jgi:SAM-dependent MidA family methyltransferase
VARPWREAWAGALYGPGGFYARGEAPREHFRTSVHASVLYAAAVGELLRRVDEALGRPDPLDLVDVGAGRGELLAAVPGPSRLRRWAVEVGPVDVPGVTVVRDVADLPRLTGLLVANEWLDDLPVDVVEGDRVVLVDEDGTESHGGPPDAAAAAWLARWWPAADRAEVGLARDAAWAAAVGRVERGVAVAVDYGHEAAARPPGGTLTGFRDGRQVPPVPDGSCNLTAHVAFDAVAAAGVRAGATETRLDTQRAALLNLGLRADRPPIALATTDPPAYLAALQRTGEAAELVSPSGLGGFTWLVQGVGVRPPFPPAATRGRVRRAPAPPPA